MQKELSQFFQVCKNPVLLAKYKANKVIELFCKVVTDSFVTFPKYQIEGLTFHGFPNDEYQETRWKQFPSVLDSILKENNEEKITLIQNFLESCHGDDSTRDNSNNVHEPEYLFYHRIFTKSQCIPFDRIYKVYPELLKQKEETEEAFFIPTGTIIEIQHSKGVTKFKDVQNSKISLDFLKFPFNRDFEATIVVSPRWYKYDSNFYNNRNAKWQELIISGIKTEDIKIYILKCSRTKKWLREIFENGGLKALSLNSLLIKSKEDLKSAVTECINKKYRAVLVGNDIYVTKPTNAKTFKIDGDIPKNSFPYDLSSFKIHYSYIPEDYINE